jgi:hypothetical protein
LQSERNEVAIEQTLKEAIICEWIMISCVHVRVIHMYNKSLYM